MIFCLLTSYFKNLYHIFLMAAIPETEGPLKTNEAPPLPFFRNHPPSEPPVTRKPPFAIERKTGAERETLLKECQGIISGKSISGEGFAGLVSNLILLAGGIRQEIHINGSQATIDNSALLIDPKNGRALALKRVTNPSLGFDNGFLIMAPVWVTYPAEEQEVIWEGLTRPQQFAKLQYGAKNQEGQNEPTLTLNVFFPPRCRPTEEQETVIETNQTPADVMRYCREIFALLAQ